MQPASSQILFQPPTMRVVGTQQAWRGCLSGFYSHNGGIPDEGGGGEQAVSWCMAGRGEEVRAALPKGTSPKYTLHCSSSLTGRREGMRGRGA